jgi:tRNA nucleotidyltransferase (CCA-adding enzyme)
VSEKIIRITLPQDVKRIINTLTEHGFEAYAVGGCVRDSILHKEPKDWDITTSARPQQVKAIFQRTIDTGIVHGTVTVMLGKNGYEVTTYRIDGEYEDGRHPKSVEFSENLLEDLKRRDFTINAMAYNEEAGVVDEFDGISDMDRRVIRCVRDAKERFTEDALRMMRAVRFSAQLGFSIEQETFAAIRELAPSIKKVSRERIQVELTKTLLSKHPDYVVKLEEGGLLEHILPVVHEVMTSQDCAKVLSMLCRTEENSSVRYAALLFLAGEEAARQELKNLRLDNHTIGMSCKLISCMNVPVPETDSVMRHFLCDHGSDFWPVYSRYMESFYRVFGEEPQEQMKVLTHADTMYEMILRRGDCISLKQLKINGQDLIEHGMKGAQVGETLKRMLDEVLEEPSRNEREWLLNRI